MGEALTKFLPCSNNTEVDPEQTPYKVAINMSAQHGETGREANERTRLTSANTPQRPTEPPKYRYESTLRKAGEQSRETGQLRVKENHTGNQHKGKTYKYDGAERHQESGFGSSLDEDQGEYVKLKQCSGGTKDMNKSLGSLGKSVSVRGQMPAGSNSRTHQGQIGMIEHSHQAVASSKAMSTKVYGTPQWGHNEKDNSVKRTSPEGEAATVIHQWHDCASEAGSLLSNHTEETVDAERVAKEQLMPQMADSSPMPPVPPRKKKKRNKKSARADQPIDTLASPVLDQKPSSVIDANVEVYRILAKERAATDIQKLVIGIDVGSASSGYAFRLAGAHECCLNKNWAEGRGYTALKAPTAYCNYKDEVYFGFEAFEKYDELLDESDDQVQNSIMFFQSAYCNPYGSSQNEILVPSVCLHLVSHCCKAIQEKIISFTNFKQMKIILTIGTNWPEANLASDLHVIQRRATELTGINQVTVDTASRTESELRSCLLSTEKFQKGGKEMVLLLSTGGSHMESKLFESVRKSNWQCKDSKEIEDSGSQSIDRLFVRDLRKEMGQDFIEALIQGSESTWYSFMESFSNAKCGIRPNTTLKVTLPVSYMFGTTFSTVKGTKLATYLENKPNSVFHLNKEGKLAIGSDTMKSYFDGVLTNVKEILHHFRPALQDAGKRVVVYFIGGLAESPLVKATVAEELRSMGCELVIPEHSMMCAAQGAVYCDKTV